MLDFATKHFLVLSSVAIVISAAISMVVLSAYLSVFDWNLVWLVEYGDLTKLFLIGAALISSITATTIDQIEHVYEWVIKQSKRFKWIALGGLFLIIIANAFLIYHNIRTGKNLEYPACRAASSLMFIFLLYMIFSDRDRLLRGNIAAIGNVIAFSTLFLGVIGITYGYYVKDISANTQEIWTKDNKFLNAKTVMLLSHHIAFIVDKTVIVLPTSEVIRVVSSESLAPVAIR